MKMDSRCRQYVSLAIDIHGYDKVFESCAVNEDFKSAILGLAILGTLSYGAMKSCINSENFTDLEKERIETIMSQDNITPADIPNFGEKVDAVNRYMEDVMKKRFGYQKASNGKPAWLNEYNKITLSAENLVLTCAKYRYDLPLALYTAYLESCLGTSKRCHDGTNGNKPTHSVWSVGSVDSGANWNYYSHDDESLEPYIRLMLKNYLVDKTVDQVLKSGKLVNTQGNRYASDPRYENKLAAGRRHILRNYPELEDTTETTWDLNPDVIDFAQVLRDGGESSGIHSPEQNA